ncbi:hypothetical protein PsorP6_002261 [Peronosclerospora sorghi]|uniref:Uncharacterized protein n=1 Tax=Peronosclerospora sorghi TaxID=230839 RepID=A0ACC0WUY3_9STRA|nr:hypothetical protein PsorP6_002261 [Peronosclerospora sorghi]
MTKLLLLDNLLSASCSDKCQHIDFHSARNGFPHLSKVKFSRSFVSVAPIGLPPDRLAALHD